MAVENDYNLLVQNLNELAKTISLLRDDVESRRRHEADEHLQPNETDWVNQIGLQLMTVDHIFNGLQAGVKGSSAASPASPSSTLSRRLLRTTRPRRKSRFCAACCAGPTRC